MVHMEPWPHSGGGGERGPRAAPWRRGVREHDPRMELKGKHGLRWTSQLPFLSLGIWSRASGHLDESGAACSSRGGLWIRLWLWENREIVQGHPVGRCVRVITLPALEGPLALPPLLPFTSQTSFEV